MSDNRHENYELLNLLGYGLAKFNMDFVKEFGFKTKTALYEYLVSLNIAETTSVIKNRQDLFDPFFDNGRKGWWQRGDAYIHRKILIDSLFGDLNVSQYAGMVKIYIQSKSGKIEKPETISPVMKSRFKQLQVTGQEAELYFMHNYKKIQPFLNGVLDDARLFGDGYDFQIQVTEKYYLAEVKGVRASSGSIRLTENEFEKAREYKNDYGLIVVSNLSDLPKMTAVFNPIENLALSKKVVSQSQTTYHSEFISW
jgi:hypothetical protein